MYDQDLVVSEEEVAKVFRIDKYPLQWLSSMIMELLKLNEINTTYSRIRHLEGIEFINEALNILDITVDVSQKELRNIPLSGGFIALANHPYGCVEGLILLKLLYERRPDIKLLANFLLKRIRNISELLIPVNPFESGKYGSSVSGLKEAVSWLHKSHPLAIFPAGEVSSFKPVQLQTLDKRWHPVVGKLIKKADVAVLPVYFHGNNGLLFNSLGFLHPDLRTARLPSEVLNKKGETITVRIGKALHPKDTPYKDNPAKLLSYYPTRTYMLGAGIDNHVSEFDPAKIFKVRKEGKPIVNETSVSLLYDEIHYLRAGHRLIKDDKFEVFVAAGTVIPSLLREIGRLREITFRAVGEGTNKEIDLDGYDAYYHHLFLWDSEARQLVGAYRIAKGNEVYASLGKHGFYTAELFKIKEGFKEVLMNSMELGRSWIRLKYQKQPKPLFLLWKGICSFMLRNPGCRYLIGPVSISNSFSRLSQSVMVDYIITHHFDHRMAALIRPRKAFKPRFKTIDKEILLNSADSIQSVEALVSEIEQTGMKVPVMLRQYLALNGKIICFNVDPKFSDSLDGLIVVKVEDIPKEAFTKFQVK